MGIMEYCTLRKIACATCRYGKTECVHVQHLSEFCSKTWSELPEPLQEYVQLLSRTFTTSLEQYPDHSCLSRAKIRFEFSSEMSTILRMPIRERFNMLTCVAELVPCNVSAICGHCQQSAWGDPYIHCDATIVTNNQLLPAKGMYVNLRFYLKSSRWVFSLM